MLKSFLSLPLKMLRSFHYFFRELVPVFNYSDEQRVKKAIMYTVQTCCVFDILTEECSESFNAHLWRVYCAKLAYCLSFNPILLCRVKIAPQFSIDPFYLFDAVVWQSQRLFAVEKLPYLWLFWYKSATNT